MADIICAECKATVSDEPGYCTECGYPFDGTQPEQNDVAADEAVTAQQGETAAGDTASEQQEETAAAEPAPAEPNTVVTTPLDIILRSLSAVALEVKDLQSRVDEIKQDLDSRPAPKEDNTEKMLADVVARLDALTSVQNAIKASVEQESAQKKKKNLLTAFYRTLNSPNSMFDYMFYICIVQAIFVMVNLFLAAYIVTLVR